MPDLPPPQDPVLTQYGDLLRLCWPAHDVAVDVDRIHEHSGGDELTALLTFYYLTADGQQRDLMGPAKLNLWATPSVNAMAKRLASRMPERPFSEQAQAKKDCETILEQLCRLVTQQRQAGVDFIDLSEGDEPDGTLEYLVHPLLPLHAASVIVAEGGAGKSMLGLALGISVATGIPLPGLTVPDPETLPHGGSVLYLDWETEARAIKGRIHRLSRGLGLEWPPRFHYARVPTTIKESRELGRKIAQQGIDFVVVDSIGFAVGGDLTEAGTATELFRIVNNWETTVLLLHHENRAGDYYGSVYFLNSARSLWTLTSSQQRHGRLLGLQHQKINDDELWRGTIGLQMQFDKDANTVRFSGLRAESSPALMAKQPLVDQIAYELQHAPDSKLTYKELADRLAANYGSVRVTVRNNLNRFVLLHEQRTVRVALATDEDDEAMTNVVEFHPVPYASVDEMPDPPF